MPARVAPTSPPKRMTRARAAAKDTEEPAKPTKSRKATTTTAITTTSATRTTKTKAAKPVEEPVDEDEETMNAAPARRTRGVAAAVTVPRTTITAPPRRRVKVTPIAETVAEPEVQEPSPEQETAPTKAKTTRARKATDEKAGKDVQDKPEPTVARKTRARAATTTTAEAMPPPTKPRGRPKKTAEQPVDRPTRSTRARAASITSDKADAQPPKATTGRKKVTFQDIASSDKENVPVVNTTTTTKKGTKNAEKAASSGIKAKPVRKAASTSTKNKTAKGAAQTQDPPKPLSPKKPMQVARASPTDSDDELSGAKTPVRPMTKSPVKAPDTIRVSPIKKLDFEKTVMQQSPAKTTLPSVMLSPARRPPPSPFKDALKGSAKRAEGGFVLPGSPSKHTDFRPKSPEANRSVLHQSPRRVQLDASVFMGSAIKTQQPLKASLLQSPAKRLFSPFKNQQCGQTPAKSFLAKTTSEVSGQPEKHTSPDVAVSCNFRASVSPMKVVSVENIEETPVKVNSAPVLDFDESILDVRSPVKVPEEAGVIEESSIEAVENGPSHGLETDVEMVDEPLEQHAAATSKALDNLDADDELLYDSEDDNESTQEEDSEGHATPQSVTHRTALFRHVREPVEESSEDELQADETPVRRFQPPSKTPMARGDRRKSRLSTINPAEVTKDVAFTPLAAQLSNWFANSPEKSDGSDKPRNGVFAIPAKRQQGLRAKEQTTNTSPLSAPKSRQSLGLRRSIARESLSPSMAGSPSKVSFFEDEMVVRDMEEELEDVHDSTHSDETAPLDGELLEQDEDALMDDADDTIVLHDDEGVSMLNIEPDSIDGTNEEKNFDVEQSDHEETMESLDETDEEAFQESDVAASDMDVEPSMAPTVPIPEADAADGKSIQKDAERVEAAVHNSVAADDLQQEQELLIEDHAEVSFEDSMSQESLYGDENDVATQVSEQVGEQGTAPYTKAQEPISVEEIALQDEVRLPLTDMVTPVRVNASVSRYANTVVSKVPLRSEGPDSSLQIPKKRSRSLSAGPSSARKTSPLAVFNMPKSATLASMTPQRDSMVTPRKSSVKDIASSQPHTEPRLEIHEDIEDPEVFERFVASAASSPSRSPRRPLEESGVLKGAVVYVDVHTSEGADANGIFVELLTEMDARCVKSWTWNPRASMNVEDDDENAGAHRKIGITHVVYKDGGKRTLEKVRDAGGVVKCVGVGWVLDCERENKWLDEAHYSVDISIFPRGGTRRRKSMEPKTLMNSHGNLLETRRSISAELAPAKRQVLASATTDENLHDHQHVSSSPASDGSGMPFSPVSTFSTPTAVHNIDFGASITSQAAAVPIPATPTGHVNYDPTATMSPMTPYNYSMSEAAAKLVQQTCPPKQTRQGLFSRPSESGFGTGSGEIVAVKGDQKKKEDEDDEENRMKMRKKLEQARRKTLGWKPRVGSPLGR